MPSFEEIGNYLGEALNAFKEPAIPEAAARGTAEQPALLDKLNQAPPQVKMRPNQPQLTSQPVAESRLETTYDPQQTLADGIQTLKTTLGGAIKGDPNLPKDLQEKFYSGRLHAGNADELANYDLVNMLSPMQDDPAKQTTLWNKYMVSSDELAQAMRDGRPDIQGVPVDQWKKMHGELEGQVKADPQVQEAVNRTRAKLDSMFGDATNRGWIAPQRYLDDYTPLRKLSNIMQSVDEQAGGDPHTQATLSMLKSRGEQGTTVRENNLIQIMHDSMTAYNKHAAMHDFWLDLMSDPTINLTDKVPPTLDPPKGFTRYEAGPGKIGYIPGSDVEEYVKGFNDGNPVYGSRFKQYVLPTPLVSSLENFNRSIHTDAESRLYKAGQFAARQYTVYSPTNTNLHRASDLLMALTRSREMGVSPLGVLRWYGEASKVAFRGTFGKGGTIVNINGQPVDVWDLAVHQGVTSGTMMHDVGGMSIPTALLKNLPEAQINHENWWQNMLTRYGNPMSVMAADRQAVELTPRLAVGMAAIEAGADPATFGRVAREVTLPYGAGAPQWARFPALRLIAPFIQFNGLASDWVMNQLKVTQMSPGKVQNLAAMMAVPVGMMMWNNQNPEYKQVEESLHEGERNQFHIIVPDPMDPARVRRDINGAPVVLRMRWWVPEEVAKLAGLSNLPERLMRVAQGKDTPIQFVQQTGEQAGTNLTGLMMTPEMVNEMVTGKAEGGREMSWEERLMRASPIARIGLDAYHATKDYGPAEGARIGAERWLGLSFAPTDRKGTKLLNAQFMDARKARDNALFSYESARRNGSVQQVRDAWNKLDTTNKDLLRIRNMIMQERTTQPAPPPAPPMPEARKAVIGAEVQREKESKNASTH